ncbi:MAG: DUF3106 domain-containing protein [Rubrivivax sp.]
MNKFVPALALAVAATLSASAFAQSANPDRREAMKQKWESMTPEQQAQAREKMRQRWESMTPEQREAAKKRLAERRGGHAAPAPAPAASGS